MHYVTLGWPLPRLLYSIRFARANVTFFLNLWDLLGGAIQVLRNAIFLEIGPPPTPS